MTATPLDIIVAGDVFIDLILSGFSEWPRQGTEVLASEFRKEIGGGAAITATALAKLGSRTAVLGVIGRDGDWVLDKLTGSGVDCSEMEVDPNEATSISVAISTPEDRTFFTYPGANRAFPAYLRRAATSKRLSRARHLHLGYAPELGSAVQTLRAVHENGCSVSLDVGWHESWLTDPRAMKLLPSIDIFFPNEVEAKRMTGEADSERSLRIFESAGARRVALKLGQKGAMLLCDGNIFYSASYPVKALDTIGAGDCFDAGFLHYWLQGASPLTCLRAGNFCGAASTEAYGGIAGFPHLTRVQQALGLMEE